jgi:hypothetical protein
MSMTDLRMAEFDALRATIRERGTARLYVVAAGLASWGALAIALLLAELDGSITLAPFLVLAATFEINFFVHTGVERIGRYLQVFYEERAGASGWETIAMSYGATFPTGGGLDPLFSVIFFSAAVVNFLSSLAVATPRPGWIAVSLAAHLAFNYRIVRARQASASQRAADLERFRKLANGHVQ